MFLVRSVCLSVYPSDYSQTCERILTKFFGGVGHGSRTKWYNFGGDLEYASDPGVQSPKSGPSGSAEVCALWMHFLFLMSTFYHSLTVSDAVFVPTPCKVPICLPCGTTRHLATCGHNCWDFDDSVVRCRSILQRHATRTADQYTNCLNRIAITDDMIKSICGKLRSFVPPSCSKSVNRNSTLLNVPLP